MQQQPAACSTEKQQPKHDAEASRTARDRVKRLVVAAQSMKLVVGLLDRLDKECESGSALDQLDECRDGCSWTDAHWIAEEYVEVLDLTSKHKLAAHAHNISKLLSELMIDHVASDPAVTAAF